MCTEAVEEVMSIVGKTQAFSFSSVLQIELEKTGAHNIRLKKPHHKHANKQTKPQSPATLHF